MQCNEIPEILRTFNSAVKRIKPKLWHQTSHIYSDLVLLNEWPEFVSFMVSDTIIAGHLLASFSSSLNVVYL